MKPNEEIDGEKCVCGGGVETDVRKKLIMRSGRIDWKEQSRDGRKEGGRGRKLNRVTGN